MTSLHNRQQNGCILTIVALGLLLPPLSTPAQSPVKVDRSPSDPVHWISTGRQPQATALPTTRSAPRTPAANTDTALTVGPHLSRDPDATALHTGSNDPGAIRLLPPTGQLEATDTPPRFGGSMVTVATSLAIVLGLFLSVAWVFRRAAPRQSVRLPREAFEFLGKAPLAGRQEMQLLRLGRKLLLLAVTPTSAETLTEITDPEEVERIAGICLNRDSAMGGRTFREASTSRTETRASETRLTTRDNARRDLRA